MPIFRRLSSLGSAVLLCLTVHQGRALAWCNDYEAFDKMMAFSLALSEFQKRFVHEPAVVQQAKIHWVMSLTARARQVHEMVEKEDYTAACRQYDALAAEIGLDLPGAAARSPKVRDFERQFETGRFNCTGAEAVFQVKMMQKRFEEQKASGKLERKKAETFKSDVEEYRRRSWDDPNLVCEKVWETRQKYGL